MKVRPFLLPVINGRLTSHLSRRWIRRSILPNVHRWIHLIHPMNHLIRPMNHRSRHWIRRFRHSIHRSVHRSIHLSRPSHPMIRLNHLTIHPIRLTIHPIRLIHPSHRSRLTNLTILTNRSFHLSFRWS